MSAQKNALPVIIKRKKIVVAGGHHGGAWKVAYADFVTAMMAFFMLMWLLNATTEKQRQGIADYFSPTISINRISGGGDGSFSGSSVFSEETLPQEGTGASSLRPTEADAARGWTEAGTDAADKTAQDAEFAAVEEKLLGQSGESMLADDLLQHIVSKVTDEGLVIEMHDIPGAPLFFDDMTATPVLLRIVDALAEASKIVSNPIAVEGHVRSVPIVKSESAVWDQSSDRADTVRKSLESNGLAPNRLARITGHADRELASDNPMSVRNNRVEVVFLRTNI
ncbi:chemotaxis protein MotB [Primorskyibacter sedentarius]|uniref:Chemotaxis protein MotB n=1 Tax=Primorskyibacter sedentarius TaxID=745311 RepID=A0A4R3JJH4_9RHOB|nr:flagellar motor protein MotB [Primorskyibacter sedentarius]TCS66394.1 chemotaxis protein MotB [Primorskyibacter sedentarius]